MGNSPEMDFHFIDPGKTVIGAQDWVCEPKYTGSSSYEHLIFLRDTYSDEIPDHVVHSLYQDRRYKVRRAWFGGVILDMLNLIETGELFGDQVEEVIKFKDHITAIDKHHLTTPEEISWANRVINSIVRDYEEEHPELRENPPYTIPNPELCL